MWQIENEYGPMEYELGAPGRSYTNWAAKMAVGLGTGVPWVMCKQDDAPDPIVSSFVSSLGHLFFIICMFLSLFILSVEIISLNISIHL